MYDPEYEDADGASEVTAQGISFGGGIKTAICHNSAQQLNPERVDNAQHPCAMCDFSWGAMRLCYSLFSGLGKSSRIGKGGKNLSKSRWPARRDFTSAAISAIRAEQDRKHFSVSSGKKTKRRKKKMTQAIKAEQKSHCSSWVAPDFPLWLDPAWLCCVLRRKNRWGAPLIFACLARHADGWNTRIKNTVRRSVCLPRSVRYASFTRAQTNIDTDQTKERVEKWMWRR